MTKNKSPYGEKIRIEGDRKVAIETSRNRIILIGALFSVAFIFISGRVVDISIFSEETEPRLTHSVSKDGKSSGRADITDRNGVLLATSLTTASLYAHPRNIIDPEQTAIRLSRALPRLDAKKIENKLRSDANFVWLYRHLTPRKHHAIHRLGIPALEFQRESRRMYPVGPLASHVLGYTDLDSKGLAGIERYFDKTLRTSQKSIALSIDVRVQHMLEHELRIGKKTFRASGAAGLVMDVNSGEVLAMASLPSYNPNHHRKISLPQRFNRATLGVYEMGSTFKIFTTAMALELGIVTLSDGYDCTNPIKVSRFSIRDYHAKKRWLSVKEIFIHSSNIGSAKMALAVGVQQHQKFLMKLGLLKPIKIELFETAKPLSPSPWRKINSMTIAYGHGMAVSPLHLAAGVAAIVNGGIYHPPTLVQRKDKQQFAGRRVISEETSQTMRHLLWQAVENGTGRRAAVPGFLIGGKTGTAEKSSKKGYHRKSLISSFVAAFPMNKPKFVILVMLDEAKGTKKTSGSATGGRIAAPIVRSVVQRIAPILGLQPTKSKQSYQRAVTASVTHLSKKERWIVTH